MKIEKIKLIFVITLTFFLVSGCSESKKPEEAPVSSEPETVTNSGLDNNLEQKVLNFSLSGTEDGLKKWDIEGDSADFLTSNIIELSKIKGKIYTKDNVVTPTADKGKVDKRSNNIELRENVVVTTEDGARLTTERLNWDAEKEFIWTDDFVRVQKDEIIATGYGVSGNPNLEKVEFKEDVKINIAPSTVITCDGPLEIDYLKSIAYLNNNVYVVDERGEILADKAHVYFDKTQKKIIKIVARGNVEIKREGNTTYSDEAIYYADEKKIVLTGKPKFIVYPESKEE